MSKFVNGAYVSRLAGAFLWANLLLNSPSAHAQTSEFRGIWVDAWGDGFLNPSQTTQLIADVRNYNFNAIIVQMRRRGDALYTPLAGNDPKSTAVAANYDALADLISKAHSGSPRIEVHCWVTTQVIWGDGLPSNPAHVVNLHPEYLMRNSAGSTIMAEGLYLDPGHPDAARWNFTMATNIVRNYDIDGFHWDYIRYPQQDSGYNATAINRYNAEFGTTGQPLSTDSTFSTWRRRQVTDFMRWANAEILGIKTNVIISASVFGSRTDALNARFQDWAAWNTEGLYDLCIPMIYTDVNSTYTSRADDAFNNQGVRRVYPGPAAYLNTPENTVWQLSYARSKPFYGTSFYSYRVPNVGAVDKVGTFDYVKANYQPTWVDTPALPWKSTPTKGLVKGYITRSDSGAPVYNANVRLYTGGIRLIKSEAHGHYAFFEVPPGTYTITAGGSGYGSATNTVTVTAGSVVHRDLVLPATDFTAPVITSVGPSSITSTNATIAWETDDLANSAVDYGITSSYGSLATNATLVTSHSMLLTNLDPSTTYFYRVRSRNAIGLTTTSAEFSFTTSPISFPDVIIESRLTGGTKNSNPPYEEIGTWSDSSAKSAAAGLTGTGSRFTGTATNTYKLKPSLPVAGGGYDVYLTHHSLNGSLSPDITVGVNQSNATGLPATTTIFRHGGGDTWEYLGRMMCNPGVSNPIITFSYVSGTISGTAGQRWYSDSAKFVYVVAPPAPPSVVSGPDDVTVPRGSNATFTVSATGASPISYRWYFEGLAINGATGSSYTVTNAQSTNEGIYFVVLSNVSTVVTSAPAALTVIMPPAVVSQPVSQTVVQGTNVAFFVTVTGSDPLHYQWRFNGANLEDGNQSDYAIQNVQPTHAGNYTVVITNVAGSTTSSVATLAVLVPPQINSAPQSRTNEVSTDASFSVGASGGMPLSYQWYFNGTAVPGAAASIYTREDVVNTDAGSYKVVVTNTAGAVTSTPALLTVTYPTGPLITNIAFQPINNILLQMNGGPGRYVIEASPDLAGWSNKATLAATNSHFSYTDTNVPGSNLFYRVKRDP